MDIYERMKVSDWKVRMNAWSDQAFLIPLISLPVAWLASYLLYRWIIVCGGDRFGRCTGESGLRQLREPLAGLPLEADAAVRVAHDVAARFAWQPTLVAFVVVALGSIASCWYLIHRSMQDSVPWYCRREALLFNAAILLVAVVLGVLSWTRFPVWIVHTEVLGPTLQAALGADDPAVHTAEQIQHLFQVLAVVSSAFVIGAASAALLTPIRIPPAEPPPAPEGETDEQKAAREAAEKDKQEQEDKAKVGRFTTHLADQWRRLSLTLYAGAALLVAAVVHQSFMYAWGNAFAEAMAETRTLRAQLGKAAVDSLDADLKIAQARVTLDTATQRVESPAAETLLARPELSRHVALLAFRADSAKHELARDTVGAGTQKGATQATMKRIGDLMSRAITRGGGLVYTILLAVTYLPAALVLMERAWELSFVAQQHGLLGGAADGQGTTGNAQLRDQWRVREGVGFSLGDQWTRILAVLSPVLASGSAVALTEIYKLITG